MAMRYYGRWAGNPQGRPENAEHCIAKVPVGGRSPLFKQCTRKRGHGPDGNFCLQHATKIANGQYVSVPEEE